MKQKRSPQTGTKKRWLPTAALALAMVSSLVVAPLAGADRFDDQIQTLQQQNAAAQGTLSALLRQASTYQEQVNLLQEQINELQAQINESTAKQQALQQQITDNETELARQRALLSADIKAMYVDGEVSSIEILASSRNLSDFIDKETYRNTVQKKIQDTLKRIAKLQEELKEQKRAVDSLLEDQKARQQQLDYSRAEQTRLLTMNAQQQAEQTGVLRANNAKIAELRSQQAAEIARLFGYGGVTNVQACGPRYPASLCNRPMDTVVDSWGMYNRECVSYVAFMVATDGIGGSMPYWGGRGNAWQWGYSGWASYGDRRHVSSSAGASWHTANALTDGIAYVPANQVQRGDVAVKDGSWGHVMYVESVNANGTINISQFNHDFQGRYSEAYNVSTSGLVFLRF